MFGSLKFNYEKKIRLNLQKKFDFELARQILLAKGARSAEIDGNAIDFKSKSFFSYHNFHLFTYIDSGKLSIQDTERYMLLIYNLSSVRIFILTGILFLFFTLIFQSWLISICLVGINFLIAYQLTYNKHAKLFEKIIKDCIVVY